MDYNIFDGHCDTMYELLIENKDGNIVKNNLHFSFNNTKDYKKYIQVLALFSDPKRNNNGYYQIEIVDLESKVDEELMF